MAIQTIPGSAITAGTITSTQISNTVQMGGPKISSIVLTDSNYATITDTALGLSGGYIRILGSGFVTGCAVAINSVIASSVTFISSTEVRAQLSAMSAGTYIIYLSNSDGGVAIRVNAITFSSTPSWNTTSPLPGGVNNTALSIQLGATSDSTVSYTVQAGSTLPTGLTLSSGGLLAGTVTGLALETTYNFTIVATDLESQTSPKAFSITIVVSDPYFKNTVLLLNADVTPFTADASTNNFAVTIAGDTKPNNFNPYTPGYYSNYFDGSGDYLSTPSNSALAFPGDFTIEAWVYLTAGGVSCGVVSTYQPSTTNGTLLGITSSNTLRFKLGVDASSFEITDSVAIVTGTWYHIAGVRSGNTMTLYKNGVSVGSIGSVNITSDTTTALMGRYYTNVDNFYLNGYISNARVVKGTALYTTTFTPPTSPLTAIANTSLLTCQSNRFIDNSTNNFTLTVAGNTLIKSFQPFTPNSSYSLYGSGYFDGTGDSIYSSVSAAGAGSFTYEAWVYPVAFASNKTIFRTDNGGSLDISLLCNSTGQLLSYDNSGTLLASTTTTLQLNTWAYVALVRNGTAMQIYINGVERRTGGSGTFSNNITYTQLDIGGRSTNGDESWNGYITDARYTKSAVYTTTFTPPTAPLTAIANTSLLTLQNNQSVNNSVFLDNSTNNFLVTRAGNTTQGTFSPYGGNWSNYFDGASDYIRKAGSGVLTSSGDVTIECWIYPNSTTVVGLFDGGTGEGEILRNFPANTICRQTNEGIGAAFTVTANIWQHFACTFTAGVIKVYINGTLNASGTYSSTYNAGSNFDIGVINTGSNGSFNGYISNFRVTRSILYTTTFTPSTTPLTPIANTSLLTCADNRLVDDSINNFTITTFGDVSVQRFSPFNPSIVTPTSYSGYFDGTGDYLSTPSSVSTSAGWNLMSPSATGTFEAWVYRTSSDINRVLASCMDFGASYTGWFIAMTATGTVKVEGYTSGNSVPPTITSTGSAPLNTWTHVAVTCINGAITFYINGTASGTGTMGATWQVNTSTATPTWIGNAYTAWNSMFIGYLSNVRMVKGVAVYTGAFTVPTSPLTATQTSGTNIAAITGTSTSLLTCQSPTFIDNSTNNFTISAFGNSQPTQQNPFGYTSATTQGYTASTIGGSGYFDGSGDYLQPSATANTAMMAIANSLITIEFWVYTTTIQAATAYVTSVFGQFLGAAINGRYMINLAGSGTISSQQVSFAWTTGPSTSASVTSSTYLNQNSWNHVAITIDSTTPASSTITIYSNGVGQIFTGKNLSSQTVDNGSPFYIGAEYGGNYQGLSGYLSDFRFLRGQLVYKSNFVPPSAPLTAVQNTTLLTNMTSAGIYNAAMMNNMETVGDARVSTSVTKYGSGAMYFDGTGDWLSVPSSPNMAFGTGDFTVECWAYWSATASTGKGIVNLQSSGTFNFYWDGGSYSTNYFVISNRSVNQLTYSFSPTINTWYHLAVSRSGLTMRLFINGVLATSVTDSTNYGQGIASIGGDAANAWSWNGYLDDLRITKGIARYTANFTPPTAAMLGM
jgi:hypothetical protein